VSNDISTITYQLKNHKLRILTKVNEDVGEKKKKKKKVPEKLGNPEIFSSRPCLFGRRGWGDGDLGLFGALLKLDNKEALGARGDTGAAGSVRAWRVVGGCCVMPAACSFALTEVV